MPNNNQNNMPNNMPFNMANNMAFYQQMLQMQQMQQNFMYQQQQQQFYNGYLLYCQQNGLNAQDPNVYSQYCQNMRNNMNNIYANNNNNNINNNNQNDVYIHCNNNDNTNNNNDPNQPKELLPRREETLYMHQNEIQGNNNNNNINFAALNNDIINVALTTTAGYKVIIPASKNMSFEDLFINYANKVGVPHDAIGTKIVFLCNGGKVDPKSKQPISSLFKLSMGNITVLDQANIVGA